MEEFKKGVQETSKEKFVTYALNANGAIKSKIKNMFRYLKYFIFPLKIFLHRSKIKRIIAWQQFYGIIYAFYCNLFKVKKTNQLTIMTFIYKPKNKLKNIYYKFIKFSIDNKYVDNIICYSKKECEYYSNLFGIESEKFKFCELGISKIETKVKYDEKDYIISPGRSNRDYEALIKALDGEKYKVKIICDNFKHKNTSNIEVYNDVMGEKYLAMLQNAFCVVIPLKDKNISSGQLVVLHAMQLKKPIIVTENEAINSYIKDSYNGFIVKKNKKELIKKIELLYKDKDKYNEIVENAYKEYKEKYSLETLGKKVGKII